MAETQPPELTGKLASITDREREVLALIGHGLSTNQIAQQLHRSEKTIQSHRLSLGRKLGVHNRVELARLAIQAGLSPLPQQESADAPQAAATLHDDVADFVCRFRPDGTMTYANAAYCRYFNVPDGDVTSQSVFSYMPPETAERHRLMIPALSPENPTVSFEVVVPAGTAGTARYREWTERGIFNDQGQLVEIQAVGRDISALRQAEQALEEQKRIFMQVADHIGGVLWIKDCNLGRNVFVSGAFERIWGRSLEELQRNPLLYLESAHPEDRHIVMNAREKKLQRIAVDVRYRIVRPDGSIRWIWDRGFPILDQTGVVRYIAGIAEDVTNMQESGPAEVRHMTDRAVPVANGAGSAPHVRKAPAHL